MVRSVSTILAKALLILTLGGGALRVNAVEPTNWFFGVGLGGGLSQLDRKYSDSAKNGVGINWADWNPATYADTTVKDWGFAWEFLAGYKHWFNDWAGFRYYANVSGQHYKDDIFTAGKAQVGIIEYTANADLLLNFYNSEAMTFGIFGGFGVGGAYFDSPAFDTYTSMWGGTSGSQLQPDPPSAPAVPDNRYEGTGKVYKHHLAATLSVGARFNIFQKVRVVGQRVCSRGGRGRQTCRVPVGFIEHSIEFNSKISLMTYRPTDPADVLGKMGCFINAGTGQCEVGSPMGYIGMGERPGYEVKNPYKFTLRYIVAF